MEGNGKWNAITCMSSAIARSMSWRRVVQGAVGCQVEAVLPGRLFQVERMDGGISQIEQLLAFVGNQDGQMAWRVTRGGNG